MGLTCSKEGRDQVLLGGGGGGGKKKKKNGAGGYYGGGEHGDGDVPDPVMYDFMRRSVRATQQQNNTSTTASSSSGMMIAGQYHLLYKQQQLLHKKQSKSSSSSASSALMLSMSSSSPNTAAAAVAATSEAAAAASSNQEEQQEGIEINLSSSCPSLLPRTRMMVRRHPVRSYEEGVSGTHIYAIRWLVNSDSDTENEDDWMLQGISSSAGGPEQACCPTKINNATVVVPNNNKGVVPPPPPRMMHTSKQQQQQQRSTTTTTTSAHHQASSSSPSLVIRQEDRIVAAAANRTKTSTTTVTTTNSTSTSTAIPRPVTTTPVTTTTTATTTTRGGGGTDNNNNAVPVDHLFQRSTMAAPPKRKVLDWMTVSEENNIYVADVGLSVAECDRIVAVTEQVCRGQYAAYTYAKQTLGCREFPTLAVTVQDAVHTITHAILEFSSSQENNNNTKKQRDKQHQLALDDREPHMVKYDVTKKERQKLDMHTDKSEWTFLISLSNGCGMDYSGGGTYFECLDSTVHVQRGHALIFPGKLRHCGQRITSGLRFLLVGFLVDKAVASPSTAAAAATNNGKTGVVMASSSASSPSSSPSAKNNNSKSNVGEKEDPLQQQPRVQNNSNSE